MAREPLGGVQRADRPLHRRRLSVPRRPAGEQEPKHARGEQGRLRADDLHARVPSSLCLRGARRAAGRARGAGRLGGVPPRLALEQRSGR